MYSKSNAKISWQHTSISEPIAISMKWTCSFNEYRALPSTIFEDTEITARLIWSPKPYFSNEGKSFCSYRPTIPAAEIPSKHSDFQNDKHP